MKNTDFCVAKVKLTYKRNNKKLMTLVSSTDSYNILLPIFKDIIDYKESFKILLLNYANNVVGCTTISDGGLISTLVDIRIVMQAAILSNATSIILAHNHPSGKLVPSIEDKALTKKIKDACNIMDIALLDHLIITSNGYYSFRDEFML